MKLDQTVCQVKWTSKKFVEEYIHYKTKGHSYLGQAKNVLALVLKM